MKPYKRADRVAGHLHKALSDLLQRGVKDPRLESATITGVRMSADLKLAKVYYAVYGKTVDKDDIASGFNQAKGHIKRVLARNLGLKYMPEIRFYYDESLDRGARIENLLKSLNTGNESDHT